MANIEPRELKDGSMAYKLIVKLGYAPDGSRLRKRKTIKAKDFGKKELGKRELNAELDKFKNELSNEGHRDIKKMSFAAFIERWKKDYLEDKEEKTQQNYSHIVEKRIAPFIGNSAMEKLTSFHIMDFLTKLKADGLSDNSRVKYYRVLKSIFHWAKEWKVIKENPMDGVPKPKETDYDADVYSEEEVAQLFEASQLEKPMFRVLILLAVTAGLRRGELLGLEWKHINLDTGIIDVRQSIPMYKDQQPVIKEPKTKNSIRKVSIPAFVVAELDKYSLLARKERLQVGDKWQGGDRFFLFANKYGLPFYPKSLSDMWRDFIKRNPGLKYIRFHDLRHTSATLLINKGIHAKTISSRLGHSNIKTTMTYTAMPCSRQTAQLRKHSIRCLKPKKTSSRRHNVGTVQGTAKGANYSPPLPKSRYVALIACSPCKNNAKKSPFTTITVFKLSVCILSHEGTCESRYRPIQP